MEKDHGRTVALDCIEKLHAVGYVFHGLSVMDFGPPLAVA
jgi:hypothetical protein